MPSTYRDKQLELLLDSRNIDFEIIAIKSDSDYLFEETKRRNLGLTVLSVKNSGVSIILNYHKIRKTVRSYQPELIESHGLLPGIFSTILLVESRMFSNKTFKIVHFRHHNLYHHHQNNRLWLFIDKVIFKAHDLIVVPSRQTQSVLIAEGCRENKIRIMPHKINTTQNYENFGKSKLASKLTDKKIRIIAVGRIDWQKNYELLLDSITYLRKTNSNFEVKIFGHGSQNQIRDLMDAIENRGLKPFIELCGWTPDIDHEMSISDIFLHTSRDESYGLVLAESLLLGIPIVSTWAGGANDLILHHDRLPCSASPESLGSELIWVIENLVEAKKSAAVRREIFLEQMNAYDIIEAHISLLND